LFCESDIWPPDKKEEKKKRWHVIKKGHREVESASASYM